MGYVATAKALTQLKTEQETVWLNEVSNVCLQQSLRRLDRAFQNFFAKKSRYPKPKKRGYKKSASYQKNGFRIKGKQVYLAKQKEPLDIRWSRELPQGAELMSLTVSKDSSDCYFVSLQVEEPITQKPKLDNSIGIDLGIKDVATLSTGKKYKNPKFLKKKQRRLALAQRRLSRKVRGSNNRRKQRLRVARMHRKIADARRDYHHKLSTEIISENQAIAVESLDITKMLKNRMLARSIGDAGWRQLIGFLRYKADWYGRHLAEVDQWFPSSKKCSKCDHVLESLELSVRNWQCPDCGAAHDRDVNAAQNIVQKAMEDVSSAAVNSTVGPAET